MKDENTRLPLLKPPRLRKGDTIAILAPSAGIAKFFPHRVERGVAALRQLGFEVRLYESLSRWKNGSAGSVDERIDEIHAAFADESVRAIVPAIGGLTANSLLPKLDYKLIQENPKILVGYSDICMLHFAIQKMTGLVTFHGPTLMTQFAETPFPLEYTINSFSRGLSGEDSITSVEASESWTDEFLDWGTKADLSRPRNLNPNLDGHRWLREGKATGHLAGGCLYSVHQVRGTAYEPNFDDAILLLETPEGASPDVGQPLGYVESQLTDLALSGIFDRVAGLIVGRGMGYSTEERMRLEEIILEQTAQYSFPILHNVNIGHCDPVLTVPLGVSASLDSAKSAFTINELGVQ